MIRNIDSPTYVAQRGFLVLLIVASLAGIGYLVYTVWSPSYERDEPQASEAEVRAFSEVRTLLQRENPSRDDLYRADELLKDLLAVAPDVPELQYFAALKDMELYFRFVEDEQKPALLNSIKQRLRHILTLDPVYVPALTSLGYLEFYVERNFQSAADKYRRAIAVEPDDFQTRLHYAQLLLLLGDYEAAEKHNRRAIIYGADEAVSAIGVWIYTMLGEYRSAELELSKLYTYNPMSLRYHSAAIQLYEAMGDSDRAVNMYLKSFERLNYRLDDLDEAKRRYALSGLAGIALWLANDKKEERDVGHGTGAIALARYYATARRTEETLRYLKVVEREKPNALLWIHLDPKFAFLSENPQFQALTERLGLPNVTPPWRRQVASVAGS